jgi:hypothetical protein
MWKITVPATVTLSHTVDEIGLNTVASGKTPAVSGPQLMEGADTERLSASFSLAAIA